MDPYCDCADIFQVHFLYVNAENKLIEQFKYITDVKWEIIKSDVIAQNEPTDTSRLCSGAVLVGPRASHQVKDQFVYYERSVSSLCMSCKACPLP